jgi:hypothetical protein
MHRTVRTLRVGTDTRTHRLKTPPTPTHTEGSQPAPQHSAGPQVAGLPGADEAPHTLTAAVMGTFRLARWFRLPPACLPVTS